MQGQCPAASSFHPLHPGFPNTQVKPLGWQQQQRHFPVLTEAERSSYSTCGFAHAVARCGTGLLGSSAGRGALLEPCAQGWVHWAVCAPFPSRSSVSGAWVRWARCLSAISRPRWDFGLLPAVSQSLCAAGAVSPLARGREGCPQGLGKGCLEDRLSPCV